MTIRLSPIALLSAFLACALSAGAAPETADDIEQCIRDNAPKASSVQTVVLRSTNRVGDTTESGAKLHWKMFDDGLSRVLLRFSRPLDMRGAGVLLIEKKKRRPDVFMYLPELNKTRRVSSSAASSSLFGTDFSYEDFERIVGMSADATKERGEDGEIEGRAVRVLIGRPDPEFGSAYERIVTFVDEQTCVPLRIESYEPGDQLRKVFTVDAAEIRREGEVWVPYHQTIRDMRDETKTDVVVGKVEIDVEIHRKMFSARELEVGSR